MYRMLIAYIKITGWIRLLEVVTLYGNDFLNLFLHTAPWILNLSIYIKIAAADGGFFSFLNNCTFYKFSCQYFIKNFLGLFNLWKIERNKRKIYWCKIQGTVHTLKKFLLQQSLFLCQLHDLIFRIWYSTYKWHVVITTIWFLNSLDLRL